ncbi:hypothetical protein D3C75_1271580 [compost metagenome]
MIGCRIVDRLSSSDTVGISSTPSTARFSGTDRFNSLQAFSTPMAEISFRQNNACGSWPLVCSCITVS